VRKMAILAGVCVGVCTSGAQAVDLSVKSSLAQSLEANSNYQLQSNPPGTTYLPITTLNVDALARTPTMRFAATVDLSYRTYFGPGAENLLPALDRGYRGSVEKNDKLTNYKVEASRSERQASQLQLAETGVSTVGGDIITDTVEGGVRHQLTSRDLLAWSARATSLQFTSSTGTASLDTSTTGMWTHRLNELTDLIPTVQFESIAFDNPANTKATIWRGTIGLNSQLTKRLTFEGAAGVAYVTLNQNSGGLPPNALIAAPLTSGSAADWLANMVLTYKINNNATFSMAAAQTIAPDSLGVIRKFDIIGLTLSHKINHAASLTFSGNLSHQASIGGATDLYSASVSYDYQLAREWRSSIAYRFRQRVSDSGDANSHAIFLSIRRDATILPSASGQEPTPAPVVTAFRDWPAAWTRPWRNATWWQSSP
jgi:hypothetical protein